MNYIEKSIEIIKNNQSDNGAYVASPNFESYNYSWFRDGAYIAYSMNIVGEHESAKKFHLWCADVMNRYGELSCSIVNRLKNGEKLNESQFLPTRFNLQGFSVEDEWTNFQTDGFGTWLWSLDKYIKCSGDQEIIINIRDSVVLCIEYLMEVWKVPCYDCWEEHLDYIHTYTLGSIYAGLSAMKKYFKEYDNKISDTLKGIKAYLDRNMVKDNQLIKMLNINGKVNDRTLGVDASLVGMFTPYNIYSTDGDIAKQTIARIEKDIHRNNGGVYRYLEDTYFGGGEWILLACWLGWYYVENNELDKANDILCWVENHFDEEGNLPEQVLENVFVQDKLVEWENRWGENAKPLLWSHAMYLILKSKI
jgi:GH15 family glucan-1,4-alpha-glucosidase